jgi:endonuclease/exonuclease/phosphatase family metal-dependent hydrolase
LLACGAALERPVQSHEETEGEKHTLKVLAYNIHHANPPSRPGFIDIPAIARVITESGAELVALQEVDVHTERSGKDLHQAKALAEETGMHYYFFKSIDHQGGEYGNAILSKYPIEESKGYPLPYEEGTEPRAVIVVTVSLPSGERIRFASTHLDFSSDSNALMQARKITEIFEDEQLPVIMAGDFNTTPDSETINHLDQHFTRTCRADCPPTIPVVNPRRTIDFIMFSPKDYFQVKTHHTIEETYASDHLPVYAELER